MDLTLEQALYGYDDGHRQLTSSVRLDREADQILRTITDLRVGGGDHVYLTIAPLPKSKLHAFVRTWPASPGFRPGSVWSQVLLMDEADLLRLHTFAGILDAFTRPDAATPEDLPAVRDAYRTTVSLTLSEVASPRPVVNAVARQVVAAAYDLTSSREVVVERASDHERLLLDLMAQAWPELRKATALRTRHRRTESSAATFVVEIVERPSTKSTSTGSAVGVWVDLLTRDLEVPDLDVRRWLNAYGPDAGRDRTAVPLLVDLYHDVRLGDTTAVLNKIGLRLPDPDDLPDLKRALFGREDTATGTPGWPAGERDRLALALRVSSALSSEDLTLYLRLVDLVQRDQVEAVDLAVETTWDAVTVELHDTFFAELAMSLTPSNLAKVALAKPAEAELLLIGRPDAWAQPALWHNAEIAVIVSGLLTDTSDERRRATFADLAMSGEVDAAGALLSVQPQLWWSLLDSDNAGRLVSDASRVDAARRLLELAGPDRVGRPPERLTSPDQLWGLVAVSSPDAKLWKETDPGDWLDLLKRPTSDARRLVATTIALASAERSKALGFRERAWKATFADLHRALEGSGPPDGSEQTLDRALPGGSSWDWCGRLREGLARVAVDAGWSAEVIRDQAFGAGDFATDVAERVRARIAKQDGGAMDKFFRIFWG